MGNQSLAVNSAMADEIDGESLFRLRISYGGDNPSLSTEVLKGKNKVSVGTVLE